MSQYQSFFISAAGNGSSCDELNHFLRSHAVIRTVENKISTADVCGIQILVEYKDISGGAERQQKQKIDWRAGLATDQQREWFDKLRAFRVGLAKENKFGAAYMVCKDEHLAAIVQNPAVTADEIRALPHASNIMLKDFASALHEAFQKIVAESSATGADGKAQKAAGGEADEIPF